MQILQCIASTYHQRIWRKNIRKINKTKANWLALMINIITQALKGEQDSKHTTYNDIF